VLVAEEVADITAAITTVVAGWISARAHGARLRATQSSDPLRKNTSRPSTSARTSSSPRTITGHTIGSAARRGTRSGPTGFRSIPDRVQDGELAVVQGLPTVGVGEVRHGEETVAGLEAGGGVADPVGGDRVLEEQAPAVHPGLDEQQVVVRRVLVERRPDEGVRGVVTAHLAQPGHQFLAGLQALRACLPRAGERVHRAGPVVGPGLEDDGLERRAVDLLGPAAHAGAPLVEGDRLRRPPHVADGLGELEDRARVAGIMFHLGGQQSRVAFELVAA
jgi:hypothetical protein